MGGLGRSSNRGFHEFDKFGGSASVEFSIHFHRTHRIHRVSTLVNRIPVGKSLADFCHEICLQNTGNNSGNNTGNLFFLLTSSYPTKSQLETIYTEYLKGSLKEHFQTHPVWGNERNLQKLAKSTVQIYDFVSINHLLRC